MSSYSANNASLSLLMEVHNSTHKLSQPTNKQRKKMQQKEEFSRIRSVDTARGPPTSS